MRSVIDSMFYATIETDNKTKNEIIQQLENIFLDALKYVEENASDEREKRYMNEYALVVFSRRLLYFVEGKDYADYLESKLILNSVNEQVMNLRDQSADYVRTLKPHQ